MTARLLITLALLLGFIPQAIPFFTPFAEAAQQQVKKKKKKASESRVRKNFNQNSSGDPDKIPAGMSDYCLKTWLTEHRMRVGCDEYGHSFMLFDR
ncbi:MAG: hypothetical protein AB7F76_14450 [Parvibaculaceae bacterium]